MTRRVARFGGWSALFALALTAGGVRDSAAAVMTERPPDRAAGDRKTSAAPVMIDRIVVRMRPDAARGPQHGIDARRLADLQQQLGVAFSLGGFTRGDAAVLLLEDPLPLAHAKRLINELRLQPGVLAAEFDRSGAAGSRAEVARPKAGSDAATITRFIVTFEDPAARTAWDTGARLEPSRNALLSRAAGTAMRVVRATVNGAWLVELFVAVSASRAREIAAQLEADPAIRFATPDYKVQPHFRPNDPYFLQDYQWNLGDPLTTSYYGIQALEAWDITVGSSLVVAIIDTGITLHPDLAGRIIPGYDFVSDSDDSNDGDGRDPDARDPGNWRDAGQCGTGKGARTSSWHGTHVAGIALATGNNGIGVAGINWVARILPVRVLGACGGATADILEGMQWAAGLPVPGVPANPNPARVLNLSLGGPGECDAQLQSMIDQVLATGAFISVSAGNDDSNSDDHWLSACYGVSTVTATDPYGERASYSNYSYYADIAAPGGDDSRYGRYYAVWSTLNDGEYSVGNPIYEEYAGTSMASPHVAGVASLMLAINPTLSAARIKAIMADTSSYFPRNTTCRDLGNCGAGIVNAYFAVKEARRVSNVPTAAVIEFYNTTLDHYFITASPAEMDALDTGRIRGWVRTGGVFKAYATAESGLKGVCRFYIPPVRGDSHFYTADSEECSGIYDAATNPNNAAYRFYSGFVYESGAVFYVDAPVGGACPPPTLPVYRLWNNRADSNHRYTTSLVARDQMLARGYVSEGTVMCARP
ncbi:MAG: S8 family serine peptidase [Casimicrobiaceae bacterium]